MTRSHSGKFPEVLLVAEGTYPSGMREWRTFVRPYHAAAWLAVFAAIAPPTGSWCRVEVFTSGQSGEDLTAEVMEAAMKVDGASFTSKTEFRAAITDAIKAEIRSALR